MRQDDKKLWWLDRNIGATSAGMGVYGDNVLEGSWPIVGNKSMGIYRGINASQADNKKILECPEGWEIPSYAQIRSLTTLSNFTITRRANSGNNIAYFAPAYSYQIKEDGASRRISSYFPQGRLKEGEVIRGEAKSGYYLTTTAANEAEWYQVMQFIGLNTTSQNVNLSKRAVSVRCCAGTYNPSTEATTYTCSVQGYTHVFLYYLNDDGSKTYLTTWPGEQVAVYSDVNRYHPFSLTTTVDYPTDRLYVIFNKMYSSGVRDLSNVNEDKIAEREGIPFVNGGKYTYSTTSVEEGAINGYWTTQVTPPTPTKKTIVVRVSKNDPGFKTSWKYCYAWTGSNHWFGDWGSENPQYSLVGDYYIWKKEVEGDPSSLSGVILKANQGDSNDKSGDLTDITKESTSVASSYNADYCYTINIPYTPVDDYNIYRFYWNQMGLNGSDYWKLYVTTTDGTPVDGFTLNEWGQFSKWGDCPSYDFDPTKVPIDQDLIIYVAKEDPANGVKKITLKLNSFTDTSDGEGIISNKNNIPGSSQFIDCENPCVSSVSSVPSGTYRLYWRKGTYIDDIEMSEVHAWAFNNISDDDTGRDLIDQTAKISGSWYYYDVRPTDT
ncbi:MAG: hypothetical protein K2J15_00385, partial [Muribaculaceae bacterium]|nr:hypothetical protein [Muribaculaceae bacterium]